MMSGKHVRTSLEQANTFDTKQDAHSAQHARRHAASPQHRMRDVQGGQDDQSTQLLDRTLLGQDAPRSDQPFDEQRTSVLKPAEHAHAPSRNQQPAHDPFEAAPQEYYRQQAAHEGKTSAFAPYGTPTEHAAEYDAWTQQAPVRAGDYYVPQKKPHRVRNVVIVLAAILLLVAAACFLYIWRLDSVMGLEEDQAETESLLVASTPGEPYYMLLIGSDSREGVEGSDADWAGVPTDEKYGRADVIMLARVDEQAGQLTLLSIPRDTPWEFDDGTLGKLNYTYANDGTPGVLRAVSELTDIPISHVLEIHMSGLMGLVDAVGGIEVEVPVQIDYHEALTNEDITLLPGLQTLNGAQAEVFARERTVYDGGEVTRQGYVRTIVEAIISKVKDTPVFMLPKTVLDCAECVETDLTSLEALKALWGFKDSMTIYQGTAPTAGDLNSYADEQYLCFENPEGWKRVLEVFKAGGDPSTVSYDGDQTFVAGE